MKINILIEHKEVIIVREENGHLNLNHNALPTTLEASTIVKHVVFVATIKLTLTCINCGKIGHSVETCHNRKKVPIVLTTIIKSTKCVVGTKTQPVKS
jgi:hypothetical protein